MKKSGVELIRERMRRGWLPPIAKLVGFKLTKIERGGAWIEIDVGPAHSNPMGTLHGGIICDIADAAMGMAYASTLGRDEGFTTIELKANFLRPVWTAHLTAKGRVVNKGRSLGLMECRVFDHDGRLIAYATSTCMTIAGEPGSELTRARQPRARSDSH